MEPSAGLREKWQYNNFMFLLQGMVTEKITGKSWEDNIREKIFGPLGMSSSNVSIDEVGGGPRLRIGGHIGCSRWSARDRNPKRAGCG